MAHLSVIVDRIAERLGCVAGAPAALDGGITNRNFRVRFGDRECVVRLHGKDTGLLGIDRQAEHAASRQAAQLGIAPAVVDAGDDYLVTEFLPGAPIDNGRLRRDPARAALALRAFHDSGLTLPVRFWVPDLLDEYAEIARARGATLPEQYAAAQALAGRISAVLPLDDPVACHDDLLPGNILAPAAEPDRVVLVDWEYAGMGHRLFDLGNLAVNNDFDEDSRQRLLASYYGEPATPGRRAALRLMALMSDAREAAWGVVQGSISELDFDFGAYAQRHFTRLAHAAGDPRLQEWLDGATA